VNAIPVTADWMQFYGQEAVPMASLDTGYAARPASGLAPGHRLGFSVLKRSNQEVTDGPLRATVRRMALGGQCVALPRATESGAIRPLKHKYDEQASGTLLSRKFD